jgi:hypothetical protein
MNITLKHIPGVISNVNRYLNRKTSPKSIDDYWIQRISHKKLDAVWDVCSLWQRKKFNEIFSDITSNLFTLKDFATYVALYKVDTDEIFVGAYSDKDRKKIQKVSKLFSQDTYRKGVSKLELILAKNDITQSDLVKINSDGNSLIYELLMSGELDIAVVVNIEPYLHSSSKESEEHKQFKKWLKILHAIRKDK